MHLMLGKNDDIAYPHEGTLKFSEVTIDQTTGSVTLRAVVPNAEEVLMPGLFVRTKLELGKKEALLVPQRASTRQPDGSLVVWVVGADNKANPRTIIVDSAYKDQWIVTSGVQDGETIIIEGYQKVGPGSSVAPSPWKKAEKE